MKIKYNEGVSPVRNEHAGFTFYSTSKGNSASSSQKNDRFRRQAQWLRQQANQKAVIFWRDMSPEVKAAWNLFAATHPQPTAANPDIFLTGYQCFVKRNTFCFLNYGLASDFMEEPVLIVPESHEISFEVRASNTSINCTELYIKRFGLLPKVGDTLLFYAAVYAEKTGHFYPGLQGKLIVQEVYIDGLFVHVEIPKEFEEVTISLYLSKPFKEGVFYVGSKTRYMGCFTPKKFTDLQDVPTPTAEQNGWVWSWDEVSQTWILVPQSGGGFKSPATISSTTENSETETTHTHELNELHPAAKTTVYSTVTIDKKGRVTALSSGALPTGNFFSANSNINNSAFGGFLLTRVGVNWDYWIVIILEFTNSSRTVVANSGQYIINAQVTGTTVFNYDIITVYSTFPNDIIQSIVVTGSYVNFRWQYPSSVTKWFRFSQANLGQS